MFTYFKFKKVFLKKEICNLQNSMNKIIIYKVKECKQTAKQEKIQTQKAH